MNIVYFNPDEMRADMLACYGHPLAKTPNFDRLARQGVRFDQCHVQHTVCTPSRCSFMTGWYPHVRGHRTLWHCLRTDEPNTLKYLKQAGYNVQWVGKNDLLSPESMADSVSHVHDWGWVDSGCTRPEPGDPHHQSFLFGPMSVDPTDKHQVDSAIRFIRSWKPGDAPYMLFIAIGQPHCPYTVPEPWYSMVDPDSLPSLTAAELPDKPDFYTLIRESRDLDKLPDYELRRIMAVYLGMVSYVDHLLGTVLDALDEAGQADDTAVFAFSDHGDWAGDFGLVEKWPSGLDDCLTRVPMIVRTPGCAAGHVVHEPIECFDIVPTTLELADITPTHIHFARSMTPQLQGAPGDADRAIFAEGGYDPHDPHCFEGRPADGICSNPAGIYYPKGMQQQDHPESVCRATMIRTMAHKLVRRTSGQHELYDLSTDPRETHNRWGDPTLADVQQQLLERMLDWYVTTADVVPTDPDPRGFPADVNSLLSPIVAPASSCLGNQ